MKELLLLSLSVLFFYQISFPQKIKAYKTFDGVRFEMDSLTLGLNEVLEVVKVNPEAYQELKRAKANSITSGALIFTGGILLSQPMVTAIAGDSPEWGLVAGGAALILTSIYFTRTYRSHALRALDIYNTKFKSSRIKPEFQFYGRGARLILRF